MSTPRALSKQTSDKHLHALASLYLAEYTPFSMIPYPDKFSWWATVFEQPTETIMKSQWGVRDLEYLEHIGAVKHDVVSLVQSGTGNSAAPRFENELSRHSLSFATLQRQNGGQPPYFLTMLHWLENGRTHDNPDRTTREPLRHWWLTQSGLYVGQRVVEILCNVDLDQAKTLNQWPITA